MAEPIEIRADLGGRRIARDQVRAWESRRAAAVLEKLASRLGERALAELLPDRTMAELLDAPLEVRRVALTELKIRLGHAGIYALLKRDLIVSERMARAGLALSRDRTEHSAIRLEVPGYSAERFAAWFENLVADNREAEMVAACPDHYLLRGLPDGRQEVVETTGGSPMPARFLVDYTASDALTVPVDTRYPLQIAGHAVLDDGVVIGGVRHQFGEQDGTLKALLTVQFPATLPGRFIEQHRWHLAAEFSNWLIAAAPVAATV